MMQCRREDRSLTSHPGIMPRLIPHWPQERTQASVQRHPAVQILEIVFCCSAQELSAQDPHMLGLRGLYTKQ